MKIIGYWMASLLDEHLPLPQEFVGHWRDDVRDVVCNYLENGALFETYRGHDCCRFLCGTPCEEMGNCEFTDGEWVWPYGLVHYVRHHSVVLPSEFVATATSGGDRKTFVKGDATLDFWIAWAQSRRSPKVRERLSEALAAARRAEPQFIESILAEIRRKEGEGSDKCTFRNCGSRVLLGRRVCARHTMSDSQLKDRCRQLYCLPVEILRSV
jgi:hypothetical protein